MPVIVTDKKLERHCKQSVCEPLHLYPNGQGEVGFAHTCQQLR